MQWVLAILALTGTPSAGAATAAKNNLVEPFVLRSGDITIAGEVHSLNRKRCTAAIIVGGSSVRTRSDTAEALLFFLDRRTAVVLMDRRGNGLSTGKFEVPNTANTHWQIPLFGRDVADIARYLKRQGYQRVVLLGTSMGGWVNAAAAVSEPRAIDAVASVNGGASTVGISDEFDRLMATGVSLGEAARRARSYRGTQGYDPRRDLARVRQPFLWIFAMKDASNPSTLDLAEVRSLARRGRAFRWLLLPNANHELIDETTRQFDKSWIAPLRKFIRGRPTRDCR